MEIELLLLHFHIRNLEDILDAWYLLESCFASVQVEQELIQKDYTKANFTDAILAKLKVSQQTCYKISML